MIWEEDLTTDIRFHDERDDRDWPFEIVYFPAEEFSKCNREMLAKTISTSHKTILEIGVARNAEKSSTVVFIDNKCPDATYLGVDIEDKSHLNDSSKHIYTMRIDSSQVELVMERLESITGKRSIDFLFIDGLHSINQVLLEWEYTKYLADGGVVGFHDTNKHPGPSRFVNALDRTKWDVSQYCNECDNGIAFVRRHT